MSKTSLGDQQTDKSFPDLPADLMSRWRYIGPLGKGGQAKVYELEHLQTKEHAAVKILKSSDSYTQARMKREIEVLTSIQHSNVIQVIESATDSEPYYVMPCGQPLGGKPQESYWLQQSWESPAAQFDASVQIVLDLLDGLQMLHVKDYVHRDIKPENILMLLGRPVLADFGIVHVPEGTRLTERHAGTRFAPFTPALYDYRLAPPAIDCYGIACLWSWMLAEDSKLASGHYHWRYHVYIDEPRCEIARAVLAACSELAQSPANAAELKALLTNHFKIGALTVNPLQPEQLRAAAEQVALALAGQQQQNQAEREILETLTVAGAPALQKILVAMRDYARTLSQSISPGTLSFSGPDPDLPLVEQAFFQALSNAKQPSPPAGILGRVSFQHPDLAQFQAQLNLLWHIYPFENGSPYSVELSFAHGRIPNIGSIYSYHQEILPDGTMPSEALETFLKRLEKFFTLKELWLSKTGEQMTLFLDPPWLKN